MDVISAPGEYGQLSRVIARGSSVILVFFGVKKRKKR